MESICYLVANRRGVHSVRKTKPALNWNEIAVRVEIDLPDVLFQRPHLEAKIVVDKDAVQPVKMTPEILVNTKDLIEQQTGCKIDLKVLPIEQEEKSEA